MKALQQKLMRIIDNKIVDILLLAGLITFLAMNNLLKWQMFVILFLMVLIIGLEIASVILTRSFISGENLGWAAVVILPAGAFGYIFIPVAFYLIHILSDPLKIQWPLISIAIIFATILALMFINPKK